MCTKLRTAVIGAGSFGRHHARAIRELDSAKLTAIVDVDLEKARQAAQEYHSQAFRRLEEITGLIDAAIVATPTVTHEQVASQLIESGIDVLVEKPIADSSAAGERLARLAQKRGRILQIGHLERFNPVVLALEKILTIPLFFEIHRLSIFTPRSLDIDVVLDLMIHDLDIVLSFTRELPDDIRAGGISVLSPRVDIANVRLSFASGCIANLTASRVSTEKVRKLRLFQPGEYISLDYQRQEALRVFVRQGGADYSFSPSAERQIGFEPLPVERAEPLRLELESFFAAVRARTPPRVDGFQGASALRTAEAILAKIKEHEQLVLETVRRRSGLPS
ncbi:MAG TPA: Gfo/Idh/MocA family oxidoreductase [Bryobacteraceae bacterium]